MSNFLYMREIFKLIRVHQWIKNLLILIPLAASHNLSNLHLFFKNIYAVFTFSILASIVYLINDFKDLDYDKMQMYKKSRPLATGSVSKKNATNILTFLILFEILLIMKMSLIKIGRAHV